MISVLYSVPEQQEEISKNTKAANNDFYNPVQIIDCVCIEQSNNGFHISVKIIK
jgi:hypothetical protein